MKNDDYGFYGKGLDGYVHYRQGMQEAARSAPNSSGGRRPVSAEQKTTENPPKSTEPEPLGAWIKRNPLHTACIISWCVALLFAFIENMSSTASAPFMTFTAIFCAIALICLAMEIIKFVIWFFKNC